MDIRSMARTGGALYLVIIVIGLFGEVFVRGRVFVPGDAAATAANLRSMESLWRFGFSAELFYLAFCALPLAVIFYVLLRPANRDLALMAILFNLVSIALDAGNKLYLIRALFPLGSAEYLKAFTPEQLDAMATLAIRAHGQAFAVSLIFFGCECVVLGYLIFRSGYLPRTIGVLMQLAGASYLMNSFTLLLSPALAGRLFPFILIPAFIGEVSLCLWLLVMGVNVQRWQETNARLAGHA